MSVSITVNGVQFTFDDHGNPSRETSHDCFLLSTRTTKATPHTQAQERLVSPNSNRSREERFIQAVPNNTMSKRLLRNTTKPPRSPASRYTTQATGNTNPIHAIYNGNDTRNTQHRTPVLPNTHKLHHTRVTPATIRASRNSLIHTTHSRQMLEPTGKWETGHISEGTNGVSYPRDSR